MDRLRQQSFKSETSVFTQRDSHKATALLEEDESLEKELIFDINQSEYGIGSNDFGITDIYFQPSEFGIVEKYSLVRELYKV